VTQEQETLGERARRELVEAVTKACEAESSVRVALAAAPDGTDLAETLTSIAVRLDQACIDMIEVRRRFV